MEIFVKELCVNGFGYIWRQQNVVCNKCFCWPSYNNKYVSNKTGIVIWIYNEVLVLFWQCCLWLTDVLKATRPHSGHRWTPVFSDCSEATIKLLDIGIQCLKTEMTSKHYNGQVELLISRMQCTYQYYWCCFMCNFLLKHNKGFAQ